MRMKKTGGLLVVSCVVVLAAAACGDDGSNGLDSALSSSTTRGSALMPGCVPPTPSSLPAVTPTYVASPQTLFLWPPNHKFHTIDVSDCVHFEGVCDDNLSAEFVWGSSDEPVDDLGDGHFAPDILFDDCGRVQLRAERQGPRHGRVYKLGVHVVDGRGVASDVTCSVIVDHDQRGVDGSDSGESYRVTPSDPSTGAVCNGVPPVAVPPVTVPVTPPPGNDGPLPIGI